MYFRIRHVQVIATALSDGPIYFFFILFTFFLTLQSVIVVVMHCSLIFLLFTVHLCKHTEAETIHLQSNEVISST